MNKLFKNSVIAVVHGYQRFVSPLFPPSCRYYPSCSSYMIKAVEVHGAGKGVLMGIFRILRCHPFAKGGLDYVPTYFSLRKNNKDTKEPTYEE